MQEANEIELGALADFLRRHNVGVDDLFFVVHLGAKQLARKADLPAPQREHWSRVSEECYDLWHNTLRDGKPVR